MRLQATGVAQVESEALFARSFPVVGWMPINASVKIGNIPKIVKGLGGEHLYGNDPTLALREIIQNASDAIRARRSIEQRGDTWGQISVRIYEKDTQFILEVEDNGIGMSEHAIIDYLLDFGATYWGSELSRGELPGLSSSKFESTGKFGIGFFSIFMLGANPVVFTRRPTAGINDTLCLDFRSGLSGRPMIRKAKPDERLYDAGTLVRIPITGAMYAKLVKPRFNRIFDRFVEKVAKVAPALDVSLSVAEGEGERVELGANSWKTCPPDELLRRLDLGGFDESNLSRKEAESIALRDATRVRPIFSKEGKMIGRGMLSVVERYSSFGKPKGVVSVGGLVGQKISGVIAVLEGRTDHMSRNKAVLSYPPKEYSGWISEQCSLMDLSEISYDASSELIEIVSQFGVEDFGVKYLIDKSGPISFCDFIEYCKSNDVVNFIQDASFSLAKRRYKKDLYLNDGFFVCPMGYSNILVQDDGDFSRLDAWGVESNMEDPYAWTVRKLADAWGFSATSEVMRIVRGDGNDVYAARAGAKEVKIRSYAIRKSDFITN